LSHFGSDVWHSLHVRLDMLDLQEVETHITLQLQFEQ